MEKTIGEIISERMNITGPFESQPYTPELKAYWDRVNSLTPPSKPDLSQATVKDTKHILWDMIKARIPNFEPTELKIDFIKSFVQWVYRDPECKFKLEKGFLLIGNYGSGKTELMKCLSEWTKFIEKRPFEMCFTKEITEAIVKTKDLKLIDKYKYQSWCFDEIGHEEGLTRVWGNAVNVFGNLFESRVILSNKPIHATTNQSMDKSIEPNLFTIYGGKVYSRLHQLFNIVVYNGKDYRIENY